MLDQHIVLQALRSTRAQMEIDDTTDSAVKINTSDGDDVSHSHTTMPAFVQE